MAEIIKAGPNHAGCWVDGHWGVYGVTRVIDIATGHGWDGVTATHQEAIDCYSGDRDTCEGAVYGCGCPGIVVDLADGAEQWLNDNCAPDGYSFGWHDGEFFLWSDESWSEESY